MKREAVLALAVAMVVVAVVASVSWVRRDSPSAHAFLPDLAELRCASSSTTTQAPTSTPGTAGAEALARLASEEAAPFAGTVPHGGHDHDDATAPPRVSDRERDDLAGQLGVAIAAACTLQTPAAAQRAGYTMSSFYTQGVGTHWINWSLVDEPFDPARPSMLLFAPRSGTNRLVGFSYWSRSATEPAAFAGDGDHWHRHYGLCFDRSGILGREEVPEPSACAGTWLNGGDLWMLHAWVVPGQPNPSGLFAPRNPVLCDRNVADIVRCPGVGVNPPEQ